MITKLGRVVAYLEGLLAPTHKVPWLFNHLVLRDHRTNYNHYTSTITMRMATKLGTLVTYLRRLLLTKPHVPLITYLSRSLGKLKILYLHCYSAFCHQIWQCGNIQWGFPTHQVTWSFSHVFSWGQKLNTNSMFCSSLGQTL